MDSAFEVTTTLRDFAIVTYAVDPKPLAALLPSDFEVESFPRDDGSRGAFVSAVPFHDVDFRLSPVPWLRFSFGQINYRAYVRYRGERVVWFFGTVLGSPLVVIPRYLWRLPWHHAGVAIEAAWDGERCERYALDARGAWGAATLSATGTHEPMGRLDGFADEEETGIVLTHPLRGYFRRRDGRLGTYAVAHDRLHPTRGVAQAAHFTVFQELGLIAAGATPHSVLFVRATEFVIELPPTRVRRADPPPQPAHPLA
jgi:uncharacterized protein YqjF (DUF2071 family)